MSQMFKNITVVLILVIGVSSLSGQSLQGIITDSNTAETLVGVNVYLPEYSKGTVSQIDGSYNLENLRPGTILVQCSMIGYKTRILHIKLGGEKLIQNIDLEPAIIEGEEIVITGGFYSSQHENVIKISTIKPKEILQSGSPSFIESLTRVPGVDMISKGPGVGTPVIRGLSLSNILFLNNGSPMNNFQFSENHPFMVDDIGIQKVEVVKGPASLLYGSGAVGGVLNLIKEPPVAEGRIMGEYVGKYFSNTSGIVSNFGLKGTNRSVNWGLNAGINSNKDYYDGDKNRIPNTRFNRTSFKANAGLIQGFGSFRLFYDYNYDKLGMAVLPALTLVSENGRKNEVWYQDLKDHLISFQSKLFLGRFKLDVNLSYQMNNRKLLGSEHEDEPDHDPLLVDMDLSTFNYKIQTTIPTNDVTKIIFGLQGMDQTNKNYDAPQRVVPDAHITDFSLFGLGQHYHWDHLMIQAGIRWDYRYIHVPEQVSGGHSHEEEGGEEPVDSLIKIDRNFNNLSLSIGATLNLAEETLFRLNIASAFRSPNLAELTQNGEHGIRFEQGNANLDSQRNLEFDLSYHFHSNHVTLDLSAFYNNIFNYIYLAPTSDTTMDGDKIYRYSQTHAYLYGGEALIHFHPHPWDWLHVKADWSYVMGKEKGGDYLPFIPAQKIRLELEFQKEKWKSLRDIFARISTDFVFQQNHPSEFEMSSSGYTLLNLGFGTDISVKNQYFTVGLFFNNLLNKTYIDHLSTLRDLGLNNMGRNISLSVKIPFGIRN